MKEGEGGPSRLRRERGDHRAEEGEGGGRWAEGRADIKRAKRIFVRKVGA